jgi:hypothetical protein
LRYSVDKHSPPRSLAAARIVSIPSARFFEPEAAPQCGHQCFFTDDGEVDQAWPAARAAA